MSLYLYGDRPVSETDVEIPEWIAPDITASTVAAICEGGCDSGAYMPAVSYYDAFRTMDEFGDQVLCFIDAHYSVREVLDTRVNPDGSWAGFAVAFLSTAAELWADFNASEIMQAFEAIDKEGEGGNA